MGITTGALGTFASAQSIGTKVSLLGTASSAISSVIQGDTARMLAESDARSAVARAQEHAAKLRNATRRAVGSARAATAGSGVALDEFSNIVTDDIERRGAQDEATAVLSGEQQAIETILRGSMARNAAYGDAGGTLLKGAIYSGWKGVKKDAPGQQYGLYPSPQAGP